MPIDRSGSLSYTALDAYNNEKIIFLGNSLAQSLLARDDFQLLANLPAKVWVLPFPINFLDANWELEFHFELAKVGKYLVEDLAPETAQHIKKSSYISIMPLKLEGVSGSPCRVVVFTPY